MNKKNFKFLTAIIAIGLSIGTISANGEEEGNQFKNTGKSRLIFESLLKKKERKTCNHL